METWLPGGSSRHFSSVEHLEKVFLIKDNFPIIKCTHMIGILLHKLKQNKESINSSTTATAVNIQQHFLPCFVENIIFAVADLYSVAEINVTHTHTPLIISTAQVGTHTL